MSNIVESSLNQLTKLGKPFKYIGMVTGNLNDNNTYVNLYVFLKSTLLFVQPVTCIILQKNGAGLHTASSCFWDNTTDGKTYCKTGHVFQI